MRTLARISLLALTVGAGSMTGCASTQTADLELQAAQQALADALAAKAKDCAGETVAAAEAKLAEAKKLAEDEDYEAARAKAQEAETLANQARGESPPGCDEPEPEREEVAENAGANIAGLGSIEQTIYFDFNEATIRQDSKALLTKVAQALGEDPSLKLEIEGHCDSRGSTEYNLHLGERRARAVEKYLVTQGVKPDQLAIISYGEERPADLGMTDAAHDKNRRAELKKL